MFSISDLFGGWQIKVAGAALIVGGLLGWHYLDKSKAVTEATTEYKTQLNQTKGSLDAYEENLRLIKADYARQEEATRKYNEIQKRDAEARARASSQLDGLLNTIARSKESASTDPSRAIRIGATYGELFGYCSKEYETMAEAATRHAREVNDLLARWPKGSN